LSLELGGSLEQYPETMRIVALVSLLILGLVLAQAAPKASHTVAQIRAKPSNNQKVVLTGQIVSRSGDNDYQFADSSGQIEISPSGSTPLELPIGARVTLEAEVDLDQLGGLELDVLRVWLPNGRVLVLPKN
jgi:uncharacterized protein YdeI (BOF family)